MSVLRQSVVNYEIPMYLKKSKTGIFIIEQFLDKLNIDKTHHMV